MAAYTRKQYSGAARNTTTTTLLTNVGTTVDIAATTGWPSIAGIPFYVVLNPSSIYEEKCLATISGSTLTLVRAQDDTTASEHPIGSVIYPVFTANDADEANELVSKLTTKGDLLTTDGNNLLRLGVGTNGYFLKASSSASAGIEWASIPTINSLDDVGDVTISNIEGGDFLVYDSSASVWANETIHFITVSDNPPNDEVAEGDLWYNSIELELYTYYSGSWVQMTDTQDGIQELYELFDVLIEDPVYGETLVYNGTEWENGFPTASNLETARIIALSGDVSGSVLFDGSASVNISTTIQSNSVALGTDTTGSYVQSLTAGTGVTLSNNSGESATPTIAIGQAVGTTASVLFAHVATDSLNITNNVVGGGNITLSPNVSSYAIGDTGPAGGKIFITPSTSGNTTGKYFEAAPVAAQVLRKWATDTDPGIGLGNAETTVVGADGTAIGTGQQNTADIVAQTGNVAATSAAVYCDEYTYGGFSDWFLPSKDELNELYLNQVIIGGFLSSYYSSSSEVSNEAFWFQSFIDGNPNTPYKNNAYYIRPVRSFVAPSPSGIITGNLVGNVTGNSSTASTLQTARTISLTGDVSGSVSFDGSANASIAATIQPNSVALGTDTTGNYMSALTQGTGVIITHTPSEGSNATIAIGQAVGTSASVTFSNITATGVVTLAADPESALQAATKQYVDSISTGINFHAAVVAATVGNLAGTYNNGTSGVGATITKASNGSIGTIDGATVVVGSRILLKSQTDSRQNGIYTVTAVGSASAPWVVTRATDADNSLTGEMLYGDFCFVMGGAVNAGYGYINNSTANPIVLGTDNVTYTAFNAAETITAGTGLNLTTNVMSLNATLDNLSNVTAPSPTDGQFLRYNSASTVWVNDTINLGTDTTGDSDDVTEGTTNLYFTDARARSALLADNAGTASGIRFIAPNTGTVELISQEATRFVRVTSNAAAGGGKTEIQGSAQILASSSISDPGHLTVAGSVTVGGGVVFEGDTANDYETSLVVVDPTADRTVSIPNESGTLAIGQNVSTSASVTFANVTATGNVAISGRIDKTTIRESVADTSVSASVVTADYATGDIFYVGTAPGSNFTVNLTNAPTDDGKAITVVLFVTQGATGYYPNVVQVAGSAQTIKWANGAAPTPTSSAGKIDIFSFTFVRRSAAWTVFGSSNLGY